MTHSKNKKNTIHKGLINSATLKLRTSITKGYMKRIRKSNHKLERIFATHSDINNINNIKITMNKSGKAKQPK